MKRSLRVFLRESERSIMWLTTSFESFDGEGEDVGYDEGLGGEGTGTAEEEAHYFLKW
jgi:hypothetical protein